MANLVLCSHLTPLYEIAIAAFKAKMINEKFLDSPYFNKHMNEEGTSLITERYLTPLNDVAEEVAKWGNYDAKEAIEPPLGADEICPCGRGGKYRECCLIRFN